MPTLDKFTTIFNFKNDLGNLGRLEAGIARTEQKLRKLGLAAIAVGAALGAMATKTLTDFGGFEQRMRKIEGLVGVSRKQLKAWVPEMQKIGIEFGHLPNAVADSMFFITSAGLKGQKALDALRISAKLSASGMGEMMTMSKLLTTALNVYKDDATFTAEKAADQIVMAARQGTFEPSELAGHMGKILALAKPLGVEFGEVAGALAAMSRGGIDVAEGATALRAVFDKVTYLREGNAKFIREEFGLELKDIRKAVGEDFMKGLASIRQAMGDDVESIKKMFSTQESYVAFMTLTGDDLLQNIGIVNSVTGATGTLHEAFKAVTDTLENKWIQLIAAATWLTMKFGESISDNAKALIDMALSAMMWMHALGEGPTKFLATVMTMAPVLIAVGLALGLITFALRPFVTMLVWGARALGIVAAALRVVALAMGINPILLLIGALLAMILYWDEIIAVIGTAFNAFKDFMREAGLPVDDIFAWIATAWDAVVTALSAPVTWFTNTLDKIGLPVDGIFSWLSNAWTTVKNFIGGPTTWWTSIVNVFSSESGTPFGWLKEKWTAIKNTIGGPTGWWSKVVSVFSTEEGSPFTWLKSKWSSAKSWIKSRGWFKNVVSNFSDFKENPFGWIKSKWTGIKTSLNNTSWWPAVIDSLKNDDGKLDPFSWITTAWEAMYFVPINLWKMLPTLAQTLEFASQLVTKIGDAISATDWAEVGKAIGKWIANALTGANDSEETKSNAAALGLAVVKLIVAAMKGLGMLVLGIVEGAFDIDLKDAGKKMIKSLKEGIRQKAADFRAYVRGLLPAPIRSWLGMDEDATADIAPTVSPHAESSGIKKQGPRSKGGRGFSSAQSFVLPLTQLPPTSLFEPDPLPVAPNGINNFQPTTNSQQFSFDINKIEINAPSGDPDVIASQIEQSFSDQMRRAVESADTMQVS